MTDIAFTPLTLPQLTAPRAAAADVAPADSPAAAAGYAAGYAEGLRAAGEELERQRQELDAVHRAAVEAGRREVQARLSILGAATLALAERTAPALDEAVDELAQAALALATEILGAEVSDRSRAALTALDRIRPALDGLVDARIALHPGDLATLDAETLAGLPHPAVADASLEPGDAVVRFAGGMLDARLRTAVDAASGALRALATGHPAGTGRAAL